MADRTFTLRRAIASDAPILWAIRADAIRQTCRSHYPVETLERWASSPIPESFADNIEKEYYVVGTTGEQIAGFAALKAASAQIDAVFVSPRHGHRGLGQQLMAHLEAIASQLAVPMLGVCASLNAVSFYRGLGYQVVSEGTFTTSAGVKIACARMQKQLGPLNK